MKVRYVIKFTKESEIKFISHLDLMRTIQKVIRRADLPIEYSKGFNPHMSLSIANPLSVGVYSHGEYMDIVLTEDIKVEELKERLNANSAQGIRFLEAKEIIDRPNEKKFPQSMALVDAARYIVKFKCTDVKKSLAAFEELLKVNEWMATKKSKNGEKVVDIRTYIKEIKHWENEGNLVLNVLLACGSREHLSCDTLNTFIKESIDTIDQDAFVDVKREEMLALKNDKLVPIYQYI